MVLNYPQMIVASMSICTDIHGKVRILFKSVSESLKEIPSKRTDYFLHTIIEIKKS